MMCCLDPCVPFGARHRTPDFRREGQACLLSPGNGPVKSCADGAPAADALDGASRGNGLETVSLFWSFC